MTNSLRIGTLVGGGDAVRVIPQIAPHGFESFSLTFWQTTGETDLAETAKRVRELQAEHGFIVSTLGIFGNPLTGAGDSADTLASWERLIDHAHLFGTDIVSGFTGRLTGNPSTPLFLNMRRCSASCPKERRTRASELRSRTATWAEHGRQGTGTSLITRRHGR